MAPLGRNRELLVAGAVGVVAVVASVNSLGNDFAYDDILVVERNEDIHNLRTLPGTFLKPYWPGPHGRALGLWRPLTTWVFGVQWALWQGSPVGFHVVNVLLKALAAVLVAVLLGRLMPAPAALLGGLIFAVHPVHVEAVANVVGMSELLAANLHLGACLVAVRSPGRVGVRRLSVIGGLFLAAVLAKESAVTLPGAVLLIDAAGRELRIADLGRYLKRRMALYAVFAVVAAAFLAGRVMVVGSVADPLPPMGAEILASGDVPRVWTVMSTWPEVFRLLFFPLDLSVDYTPRVIPVSFGWTSRNGLGVVLALTALGVAWATWRSGPMIRRCLSARAAGFGVMWFVITAAPTANLFFLTGVLLAERTLFLPSVGFAAGAGWMLAQLTRERRRLGVLVAGVTFSLLLCRTIARNPTWRDNSTVFGTLIRERPESGRAHWIIGDIHFARGDRELGLASYRRAIGMVGGSYTLLVEVGRTLLVEELDRSAEHVLRRAWSDYPQYAAAPAFLAVLYNRQGRWELAEAAARAASQVDPDHGVQPRLP